MDDWANYLVLILKGGWVTIQLTVTGLVLAIVLAFVVGLGRLSRWTIIRWACILYVEFFRGSSLLVQMFWLFYVLPMAGVSLPPFATGVIALGLNVSAYVAEVVRGAILAVPKEQRDASTAINLTKWQTMRHVIIPQAIVIMLPTLGNNGIELLKASSTVSLITIADLTFQGQLVRAATGDTLIPFAAVLAVYFAIASAIAAGTRLLENTVSAGLEGYRGLPK